MRKIWVIARREYRAAVRTKTFLLTLIMMPILMSVSGVAQVIFAKIEQGKTKTFALLDLTPGQEITPEFLGKIELLNLRAIDPETKEQKSTKYQIEVIPFEHSQGSKMDLQALKAKRFEISNRIEKGEIEGLIEIGSDVLEVPWLINLVLNPTKYFDPEKADDNVSIRFQIKSPTNMQFGFMVNQIINEIIVDNRLQKTGISSWKLKAIEQRVPLKNKSLTSMNPQTGEYEEQTKSAQIANFLLPIMIISLMFVVIMVGVTPAMQGIVEEKTLRISEVLLGSVTPFQLMSGKLLGIVGVALTMAVVYLAGGYSLALYLGVSKALSPGFIAWFLLMLTMALFVYGSIFIAIGAAAGDIKETQTLLTPVMVVATLPFLAIGPIMTDPNGLIARLCSLFPMATPMLLTAREATSPGIPAWEMVLGVVIMLASTLIAIWAAGRIFRIGILMQGKGPKLKELIGWIIRG